MKRTLQLTAIMTISLVLNTFAEITDFSGDIYVGSGQTYTSLTQDNGAGLFKALNNGTVTGDITVYITSNTTETGSIPLNEFAAPYTLTIRPNAAEERRIAGTCTFSRGLVQLNGADRVTIDGSYGGSGHYLTIENSYWNNQVAAIQFTSTGAGLGCTNNTIRNCIIKTGYKDGDSYGIFLGGSNVGTSYPGPDNDNNTFENNIINDAYYGVYVKGNSSGWVDGLTISGNSFGTTSSSIGYTGIYVEYADGAEISHNNITNFTGTKNSLNGIWIHTGVLNTEVSENTIHGIYSNTGGVKGIRVYNTSASCGIILYNNLIYDIGGPGDSSPETYGTLGIYIYGANDGIKIYYNTVNLYGTYSKNSATKSAAFYTDNGPTGLDIRNNIFCNSIYNSLHSGAKAYAIYNETSSSAIYTEIDYNDYYASGTQGILGYLSSDRTTLEQWQTATGEDDNSLAVDPLFRSSSQPQPVTGSPVLDEATPLATVTTDYIGVARDATTPTMGAYEEAYVIPTLDWANLESPGSETALEGTTLSVAAQVRESGITTGLGQGAGIEAWIGWSSTNTDPSTWSDWVEASYSGDDGNNDEYTALISGDFDAGDYYFASRFRITDGNYQYGGYSVGGGDFWDGNYYVSGALTVSNNSVSWANIHSPGTVDIMEGNTTEIYARLEVPNVTSLDEASPGIVCYIGWSDENTDPSTWSDWEEATFNQHDGNHHEYVATLGTGLAQGTYYYASRFTLCSDAPVYGGYSGAGGGFWNGTINISGVLNITPIMLNVPFSENFDSYEPPLLPAGWTVEDANMNGIEWQNTFYWMETYSFGTEALDDWFFTPAISLTAGVTYRLGFTYAVDDETRPHELEVKYGDANNSAAMTSSAIFSNTNITNTMFETAECELTPSVTGIYYIGWHGFSNADMYSLYVDDIEFEMVNSWSGLVNQYWSIAGNWASGSVPTAGTNVSIPSPKQVIVDIPNATCRNLTIKDGGKLTINPGMGLHVTASITNPGLEAGLLILSDNTGTGSLLHNNAGVKGVFQRYIEASDWVNGTGDWHFLSSPVMGQEISGGWTPVGTGDDYDFYAYDGGLDLWLNQKLPDNNLTIFQEATGYLVAYQQNKTQVFSGELNVDGVSWSRSINENTYVLTGNPYACAIRWNNAGGSWMLDGIAEIAKIWSRANLSYSDLLPGSIVPATNAFMALGEGIYGNVTVQLSIPPDARLISSTAFYKSDETPGIFLKVSESGGRSAQESRIVQHAEASESFSPECDSRFYSGYAPKFYSMKKNEYLSTYAVTDFAQAQEISFGFEKNEANEFILEMVKDQSILSPEVYLSDLKTGAFQNLSKNPVYHFTSEITDDPARFIIQIGQVSVPSFDQDNDFRVYFYNEMVCFLSSDAHSTMNLYDTRGRLVESHKLNGIGLQQIHVNLTEGAYIVQVTSDKGKKSGKVLIF